MKSVETRFWEKVQVGDSSQCWEWQAHIGNGGYGRFNYTSTKGKRFIADTHRVAYELTFGEIPAGMCVCHKCDNPRCCNPAHLFIGTVQDNINDKVTKGRQSRGIKHTNSKLAPTQVVQIRALYKDGGGSMAELARQFNITKGAIQHIIERRNWRHIP